MADEQRDPDEQRDQATREIAAAHQSTAGTPRWVKAFGVIALVVIVLFLVVLLVRGGEHGPGRHSPGDGSNTPAGHSGPPGGVPHETQP